MSERPWYRMTLGLHVALFVLAALSVRSGALSPVAYLPLVALPSALLVGAVLLVAVRGLRSAGFRIITATVTAVVVEWGLAIAFIAVYSQLNPDWDLS